MEFVVSPTQQSNSGCFNPDNVSGSRALTIDANLRPPSFTRVVTNAETQSATNQHEIAADAEAHLKQETTIFMDEQPGTLAAPKPFTSDILLDSYKADASLANFLSRPVVIYTDTWTTGGGLNVNVPVWLNYFDNAVIKNKLENYAYIRCNLKIKVLVNASPFYYGLAGAIYTPLPNTLSAPIDGTTTNLIPLSQRPVVWIYPQESRGGVIDAPFIYPQTWLELKNAVNFTNMGGLDLTTFTDLYNANSVAGTDCDIIVYAWAEDVYICGPTNDAVMQSSVTKAKTRASGLPTSISQGGPQEDNSGGNNPASKSSSKAEFASVNSTQGSISEPLTNLAGFADTAQLGMKAIGQTDYANVAKGVSMAAKAGANIARSFGYTDSPIISNVAAYKSLPFHALSSSEISEPRDKLSFDPKCKLTKACEAADTVARSDTTICSLAARESYLTQFTWTAASAYNALLWSASVSPNLMGVEGAGASIIYNFTPAAWITRAFKYWRGDVVFRLRFICSQYHRGRARITWDPTDDLDAITDTSASNYNRIVDISEETDVVFKVPYMKATAMMEVNTTNAQRYSAVGSSNDATTDNGQLSIRVLTQQTSPVASADVVVVVSTWVENLIVSNPVDLPYYQQYEVQSLSKYAEGKPAMPLFDGTSISDDFFEEYAGENVTDILQLMRRKSLFRYDIPIADVVNAYNEASITFRRAPAYPGFDSNGFDSADDQVGVGQSPFNFVFMSYVNWFRAAFISFRGSINWTVNVTGDQYIDSLKMSRYPYTFTTRVSSRAQATTLTTDEKLKALTSNNTRAGTSGLALTNTRTQSSLSIAAPMFNRYKWELNAPAWATLGNSFDGSDLDNLQLRIFTHPATGFDPSSLLVHEYVSVGEDFSLQFFLNVPSQYYTVMPDGDAT